eukprot:IDg18255t1
MSIVLWGMHDLLMLLMMLRLDGRNSENDRQMCSYPPPGQAWRILFKHKDGKPRLAPKVGTSEDAFRRFYYREAHRSAAL